MNKIATSITLLVIIFSLYFFSGVKPVLANFKTQNLLDCSNLADSTDLIQNELDKNIIVRLDRGRCTIKGAIYLRPGRKLIGSGRTASADGGYMEYGTQLWGVGAGEALVNTLDNETNGGLQISNLTIGTDEKSTYKWALRLTGMSNSTLENVLVQNNSPDAEGGVYLVNPNPENDVVPKFAPVWINGVNHAVFGSKSGHPLINELTDSRFSDIYLSGGLGSIESGSNNVYSGFMVDNASKIGLLVQPKNRGQSLLVAQGGSFQNCAEICLLITGFNKSYPSSGSLISSVSFNNSNSSIADVKLSNVADIALIGLAFMTASKNNIISDDKSSNICISGAISKGKSVSVNRQ